MTQHSSPAGHEHGYLDFRLGARLEAFVTERKLGWVSGGEVGIYTRRNPDRVRGADIVFLSRQREVAPDPVVEIIPPEDRWQDVRQKIEECFEIGVDSVWIVEPENTAVHVYQSATDFARLGNDDVLKGDGTLAGFALRVGDLFE